MTAWYATSYWIYYLFAIGYKVECTFDLECLSSPYLLNFIFLLHKWAKVDKWEILIECECYTFISPSSSPCSDFALCKVAIIKNISIIWSHTLFYYIDYCFLMITIKFPLNFLYIHCYESIDHICWLLLWRVFCLLKQNMAMFCWWFSNED